MHVLIKLLNELVSPVKQTSAFFQCNNVDTGVILISQRLWNLKSNGSGDVLKIRLNLFPRYLRSRVRFDRAQLSRNGNT